MAVIGGSIIPTTPITHERILELGFTQEKDNYWIESKDEMVQYVLSNFNGYCLGVDGHETRGSSFAVFAWNIESMERLNDILNSVNV